MPHHAFYTGAFLAPPAIGTVSRSGSGLRMFIAERRCLGLIFRLSLIPTPRGNGPDDRLPTLMDVDMLDFDVLLTFAPMPVERFDQRRVCP
jgi:hypothetical protein